MDIPRNSSSVAGCTLASAEQSLHRYGRFFFFLAAIEFVDHPGHSTNSKNLFLSAAKHVRRILESALLCGFYEFLHRSKFALGQLGGCGLNETIVGMLRFEFKL